MNISYHRYGLKLRGAAGGNARSVRKVLEGFLIRVDGGYGCVQPWPELGDETLEEQWLALRSGGRTRLLDRALECAAADAASRREGRSLFEGLVVPRSHATVTGEADFAALKAEGFTAVKLKGGRDWRDVLERIRLAVAAGLRVRVDFNGVLEKREFLDFARAADDVRGWVDFVEDPMPYEAGEWERLRAETGWRLALDRVGIGVAVTGGFDVRVLKPAADAMGTQRELCPPLLRAQREPRPPVVVTSYMDHPVGQAFAAWEAGRYGGPQGLAGLLTHPLFEPDAFSERLAEAGPDWIAPGGTGLGFDDLLEGLPWVDLGERGGGLRAGRVLQNPRDPLPGGGPVLEAGQVGFATSGSTGVPSVVVHTEETLVASARAVNEWLGARAEDVWLRVLPDFHVGGYQIGVRAALAGSRVVVDDGKWDAERFAEICESEAVTLSSLVPAQVVDLVSLGWPAPSGLRAVVVGGGALEEEWWQAAKVLGWPVLRSYGATEAGSQVATERVGKTLAGGEVNADRPHMAYMPDRAYVPAATTAVENTETDNLLAVGALEVLPHWGARVVPAAGDDGAGILELSGPALAVRRFFWKDGCWGAQALADAEGWWRTADRVILSGRELRFAGRADRVVKVLGELVNLEAVERALAAVGLVAGTFVVVAVPEERRGMELVLVVETQDGAAQENAALPEALEAYEAGAAPFARIGRVVGVDRLPRSPLGKVRFAAVAALIPPRAVPG